MYFGTNASMFREFGYDSGFPFHAFQITIPCIPNPHSMHSKSSFHAFQILIPCIPNLIPDSYSMHSKFPFLPIPIPNSHSMHSQFPLHTFQIPIPCIANSYTMHSKFPFHAFLIPIPCIPDSHSRVITQNLANFSGEADWFPDGRNVFLGPMWQASVF